MGLIGLKIAVDGINSMTRHSHGGSGGDYNFGMSKKATIEEREMFAIKEYLEKLYKEKKQKKYEPFIVTIKLPKKGLIKRISNKLKGINEPKTKEIEVIIVKSGFKENAKVGDKYLTFDYEPWRDEIVYMERVSTKQDEKGKTLIVKERLNAYGYSKHSDTPEYSIGSVELMKHVDEELKKQQVKEV